MRQLRGYMTGILMANVKQITCRACGHTSEHRFPVTFKVSITGPSED